MLTAAAHWPALHWSYCSVRFDKRMMGGVPGFWTCRHGSAIRRHLVGAVETGLHARAAVASCCGMAWCGEHCMLMRLTVHRTTDMPDRAPGSRAKNRGCSNSWPKPSAPVSQAFTCLVSSMIAKSSLAALNRLSKGLPWT